MRVAILGAGISGLALAYYLQKLGVRYDLFEADAEVGGLIKSRKQGPYQLELGPQSLQLSADLRELLQELKLEDKIISPARPNPTRFVRKEGKYHSLPHSPAKLLLNSFFSWRAKLEIAQEIQQPFQDIPNETISQFFTRRFGSEMVDYLVKPVVAGICGGDPDKLLLEKTFPEIKEMEKNHGSVLKALSHQQDLARDAVFTLADGLQALPQAIASKLVSLHLSHRVEMVHRARGKYFLSIENDVEGLGDEEFDAVVLALPAHIASDLLQHTAPGWSAALQNVTYAPMAVVHSSYYKQAVGFTLNGYGALHPAIEKQFSAGSIWTGSVFPAVCPENEVLFSTFVGGCQNPDHLKYPDSELKRRVHSELKKNYSISSTSPLFQHCQVWPQALPQADMFILDVHELTQKMEDDNLYASANWMSGLAVKDCVSYAKGMAQKIYSRRPSFG